jgi:tetraprenyl-beta-curcumene synthase
MVQVAADPAPISRGQLAALGGAAARELAWGLRTVSAEVARWRTRARAIPDHDTRQDALHALVRARPYIDGAALFSILPRQRNPGLLRLLVAFQALANYHDFASERHARCDTRSAQDSAAALVDAVVVSPMIGGRRARYQHTDNNDFLEALAATCRAECATLPRLDVAQQLVLRETRRARTLDLEHEPDEQRRIAALKRFAATEFGSTTDATWWELTAGTSSVLTTIVLLALAADQQTTEDDLRAAADAYRWAASLSALLDSYVDQRDDAATGSHNYLNYYPDHRTAERRLAEIITRALNEVGTLRAGHRHLVIVASMIAMFLTNDNARSPALVATTRDLITTAGSLTRLLVPLLRAWRVANRATTE